MQNAVSERYDMETKVWLVRWVVLVAFQNFKLNVRWVANAFTTATYSYWLFKKRERWGISKLVLRRDWEPRDVPFLLFKRFKRPNFFLKLDFSNTDRTYQHCHFNKRNCTHDVKLSYF